MNLSTRLKAIVDYIEPNLKIADIGTDHGYIPIYLIKNNISNFVIATDINKGPIKTLLNNLKENKIESGVYERLGSGMKVIKENEVDVVIIAGMGGNLIADIISNSYNISKSLKYMILQPAQNPEVLRKYLFNNGFKVLEESLVLDFGKYYHTIKVGLGEDIPYEKEIYYYVGRKNIKNKSFESYMKNKIDSFEKAIKYSEKAIDKARYNYLKNLLKEIKEVKKEYEM